MRVIKFRIWDKGNKRMVAEPALSFPDHHGFFWQGQGGKMRSDLEGGLMQFTGLHDCLGKEIYEGDIVQGIQHIFNVDVMDIQEVRYDEDMQLLPFHIITGYDGELWMDTAKGGFEVVGNIYDKPELLDKVQTD